MSLDVSVVVVTYNHEDTLERCLHSLFGQTRLPDQVVITDDASTDGTRTLAREYAECHPDRVECRFHDRNRGIAVNVNDGIGAVTGDVFCVVAGDDFFLPEKIECELSAYRQSDADVVFSDVIQVDWTTDRTYRWYGEEGPPSSDYFTGVFARDFWYRAWLQSTSTLDRVGYWDEELELYGDWDYTIRLADDCTLRYVPRPLSVYVNHNGGVSSTTGLDEQIKWDRKVFNKNRHRLDRLSDCNRKYVVQRLNAYFSRQEFKLLLGKKDYLGALINLIKYLANREREASIPHLFIKKVRDRL